MRNCASGNLEIPGSMLRIAPEKRLKPKRENETKKITNAPPPADRIPVIVGVGEITDRTTDVAEGLEPLTLLEQALKRAEADSGGKLLGEIGSLDLVNFLSWRSPAPEQQLAKRL